MNLLFKKMLRDMSEHKLQFIAIFLMAFIAIMVFTGVGAEAYGLEDNLNNFYNETNMANIWVYNNTISNNTVDSVDNLSSTIEVERQLKLDSVANMTNNPDVDLYFIENNTISKYYPLEGSNINISDEDGIWLDKRFADAHDISVGDKINLTTQGIKIEKTVRGLGYSPEYVFETPKKTFMPDFKLQGFAYLSYKAIPGGVVQYNTLLIRTDKNFTQYQDEFNSSVSDNYSTFMSRNNHPSDRSIQSEIDQHKTMGVVFPIIFIVVSLLTLLTTMTRIVASQRTQIGILKSLGFKNRTIVRHYLSYGFYLLLTGAVLGFIIGPLFVPQLFVGSMSSAYTLPSWNPAFDWSFITVPAAMILLSVLFAYATVRSISHENPATTLMPKAPKISRLRFIGKTKTWKNLSFKIKWNITDINRSKIRTIITIICMVGCTVLVISSFGMNEAMYEVENWQYSDINHYNNQIRLEDNATSSQIDHINELYNGTKVMSASVEIQHDGITKLQTLSSYNDTGIITPTDKNKESMNYTDDDILITEKTAQLLHVKKGDTVRWHMYGDNKWVNSKITGICADSSTQGLVMSPKQLDKLDINFTPSMIVTYNKTVDGNITGISSVNSISDLQSSWDVLTETFSDMIAFLLIFSVILSVVILYSLSILSFTESERDLATLKILGFKSRNIRVIYLIKNVFLSVVGFLIGIPSGYYILSFMFDTMGEDYYFPVNLSPSTLLYSFIVVIGVSVIVNILFARKINKIDMVKSLKKGRE